MNCPDCQQPVSPSARFCRNCGKPVEPVAVQPANTATQHDEQSPRRAGKVARLPIIVTLVIAAMAVGAGTTYLATSHVWQATPAAASNAVASAGLGSAGTGAPTKTLPQLIQQSLPSVVLLTVDTASGQELGTGFVCDSLGDVITNAHVVSGETSIQVKGHDGNSYAGTLIGFDGTHDIALVRVPPLARVTPLKLGDSKSAVLGDSVVAIGSPLGLKDTVTTGVISGMNRDFTIGSANYHDMLQISAPIAPGNSGGPLLLENTGQVIGINTAGSDTTGNIGFSIPIDQVKSLLSTWSSTPESAQEIQSMMEVAGSGSGGSQSAANSSSFAQQALGILNNFYAYVNNQDYLDAYNLLGQAWQQSTSYTAFASGYKTTLSDSVKNTLVVSASENSAEITFSLIAQARLNDGSITTTVYHMDYTFGLENGQVRIEHGTGHVVTG